MDENRNKTKEYLKCILTEPEIKESGAQLARTYSEITDLEDQKKSLVSDFKAKIDGATASASILARKIQNGYEFRNIECEEWWDYECKVLEVMRLDTGEVIKSRPMTTDELQKKLFVPVEE